MGATEALARFAAETPHGFLSEPIENSAKLKFLDTLGVMVAGARSPAGMFAMESAMQERAIDEATVVGHSVKTSMSLAGFVNGVSAHALEYDDLTLIVGHASVCLVPACVAVAEKLNLSGRQLVEAFAVGFEVASRVGKCMQPYILDRGWHPTGIIGAQGVAAAASRMLGLDQMATRMAMGIAASSAGGVRKNVGSMGKAYHIGHGVRSGIFGAILASRGFKVDPDVIEGASSGSHQRYGLADAFNGPGNYRLEQITDGLGEDFELSRNTTLVRLHPGSTPPGAAIDGVIAIAAENDIRPEDVVKIEVTCHPRMVAIASYAEPTDIYQAKFCLPYTFAVAFFDRAVGLAQYTEQRIRDPQVLDLMRKVKIVVRKELGNPLSDGHGHTVDWGEVKIAVALKNGNVLNSHCRYAKGWPDRPATWRDLCSKYEDCTHLILPRVQVDRSMAMISDLSNLPSVRDLTGQLATEA